MKRFLLNGLTLLSLLLCVAVAVLWVRSHFAQDFLDRSAVTTTPAGFRMWSYSLATWRGVLRVAAVRHELDETAMPASLYERHLDIARAQEHEYKRLKWRSRRAEEFPVTDDQPLSRWGFIWQLIDEQNAGHRGLAFAASLPWWLMLLLCSVPLDLRFASWMRRRRRPHRQLCPSCGYDLRATPDKCPECGAAASVSANR